MGSAVGPQHLSQALSELIALKGLARVRGVAQLERIWNELAGTKIAGNTKVLGIKRGILQIGVTNAALLEEIVSFHKTSLLQSLRERHSDLRIRDLKFTLKSKLPSS